MPKLISIEDFIVRSRSRDILIDERKISLESMEKRVKRLEKLLDMVIEDPDKIKELRKIDPYGEEDW